MRQVFLVRAQTLLLLAVPSVVLNFPSWALFSLGEQPWICQAEWRGSHSGINKSKRVENAKRLLAGVSGQYSVLALRMLVS
jgi:hypothetical protein